MNQAYISNARSRLSDSPDRDAVRAICDGPGIELRVPVSTDCRAVSWCDSGVDCGVVYACASLPFAGHYGRDVHGAMHGATVEFLREPAKLKELNFPIKFIFACQKLAPYISAVSRRR